MRTKLLVTAFLFLTLRVLPAGATSVILLSEEDLVGRSAMIIRGVVLSVESAVRSQGFPVFRDVSLEVTEVLKGPWSEPVLHFALPGGELDGFVHSIPGVPDFQPGEDVLVFLTRISTGERVVVGLRQGKYRLVPDASTGMTVAERSLAHMNMIPRVMPGQTLRQALSSGAKNREAWGSLRSRIREIVAAQEAPR